MSDSKTHYDQFLAPVYSWISGDMQLLVEEERQYFEKVLKNIKPGMKAMDLGAGHGVHSFALAKLGFHVEAVDNCGPIMESIKANKGSYNIRLNVKDMRTHRPLAPCDVITCMGDTLAHLNSMEELAAFAAHVHPILKPTGLFVVSFRDFSADVKGTTRGVLVRADENRIFDCIMVFGANAIDVVDCIHEKTSTGWTLRTSGYRKLRLTTEEVVKLFKTKGLTVASQETTKGIIRLSFRV